MFVMMFFFFQAEDGIRYLVRSRGLGDVYKRQLEVNYFLVTKGASVCSYFISQMRSGNKKSTGKTITELFELGFI